MVWLVVIAGAGLGALILYRLLIEVLAGIA
jgi:hypothetical protein